MSRLKRILLVDDDETSNFLNEFLIKGLDIVDNVAIATNGQEALDYINKEVNTKGFPELVFLDLNMPVMDGFEFLEEFEHFQKIAPQKIPVYILTSSNYFKDFERAKNFTVSGYIIKPLTEEKIKEALDTEFKK